MKPVISFLSIVITVFCLFSIAYSQKTSVSIENVWLLTVDEQYRGFESVDDDVEFINSTNRFSTHAISPNGQLVVARTYIGTFSASSSFVSSTLYVWELSNTTDLFPEYSAVLELDEMQADGGMAISPDSTQLAIFAGSTIQVWSLPSLELLRTRDLSTTNTYPSSRIQWSYDGQSIAVFTVGAESLVVWDLQNNELYQHDTTLRLEPNMTNIIDLYALEEGWLYSPQSTVCNNDLSTCEIQIIESSDAIAPRPIISRNRDRAISAIGSYQNPEVLEIALWQHSEMGYEINWLDRELIMLFCPRSLSFSGSYAHSWCVFSDGMIWDTSEWNPIKEISSIPFWLGTDELYWTVSNNFVFSINDVMQSEPIESIDIKAIEGIDLSELLLSDLFTNYNLSVQSQRVLFNIGGYLVVLDASS